MRSANALILNFFGTVSEEKTSDGVICILLVMGSMGICRGALNCLHSFYLNTLGKGILKLFRVAHYINALFNKWVFFYRLLKRNLLVPLRRESSLSWAKGFMHGINKKGFGNYRSPVGKCLPRPNYFAVALAFSSCVIPASFSTSLTSRPSPSAKWRS